MARNRKSYITTFTYDCEIAFNSSSGKEYEVLKECINYVLIEHDYKNRVMPVIYLRVKLQPSIYNAIVPDQGKGKIYFKLNRTRQNGSTSSTAKTVIRDEFDYYMTDDPNTFKELDSAGEANGSAYKTCYIGLIKTDLQKSNQKTFQGVYKDTNMVSLVQEATKDMKIVIQPFINNTEIKEFTCPAVSTIGQFLNYLNSMYSFYNGAYIYYLDFDRTYLRSNDGSYIDTKDGDLKYVAFDIRDLTKYASFASGMVEDDSQDAYIIYVSGNDAQISVNRSASELAGQITNVSNSSVEQSTSYSSASKGTTTSTVTTTIKTNVVDTSAITNINSNLDANILISNNSDPNAASNAATIIAENANTLFITKPDMDSRIFSPNKQYMLCNYEDNSAYCGIYYLVKKQEIYVRTGTTMKCQMNIEMKKCADFTNQTTDSKGNAVTKAASLL